MRRVQVRQPGGGRHAQLIAIRKPTSESCGVAIEVKIYAIAAGVLFCLATLGIFLSNLFLIVIIGELNKRRHQSNQLSAFFLMPWRISAIFNEYRLRYPDGRFLRYVYVCLFVGMACFLASVIVFLYATRLAHSSMSY
jgi:hypothetical protein